MNWKPDRHHHVSLHMQIVEWFIAKIESGDFIPGMKCPPQRLLALQFEVNRSTINTAFEELKARGLVETRIGAGTFICHDPWKAMLTEPTWQQHIEASVHKPNVETIQLINDYERQPDIIRLGTGELSPHLLPTTLLEKSLQHVKLDPTILGYSEPQGSKQLRQCLCTHLQKRGIDTTPDNILIISGALQAFQLIALGLLERGSVIFQPQASYLNSIHPFQSAGMHMRSVKHDNQFKETLHAMKKNRQSLYYAMPTLENPTGRSWSMDEKTSVYEACKELGVPIIEDDVYAELLFEDTNEYPLKAMDYTGHVLYVGSISKTLSPGLRIGWIVGPEAVIQRLADIKMQTDYGSSSLSQAIVTHWLTSGLYDSYVKKLRQQLKARADFVEALLKKHFHDIATWVQPTGGFFIWLRFHEPIINKALFLQLLQQKILLNPGYIYQPNDFHHLRLSFAYASFTQLEKSIPLLAEIAQQHMTKRKSSY